MYEGCRDHANIKTKPNPGQIDISRKKRTYRMLTLPYFVTNLNFLSSAEHQKRCFEEC